MKVFKYLQLITIKNPNFNVPLNIFLFHNWTKIECLQISKFLPLKMYEVRRLKKLFRGSNCVQKFRPSYKKRRLSGFNRFGKASNNAVVQISTTVNCVSSPNTSTMKKNINAQNTEPGIWAMAAGNETNAKVIPERTTFFISVWDWRAIKPKTLKTTKPP